MQQKNIEEMLRSFYRFSGMGIALLGKGMHFVLEAPDGFCLSVGKYKNCLDACIRSDKEAFERLRETGKPYVFSCPHGIREIFMPVFHHGKVEAFLIAELGIRAGEETAVLEKAREDTGNPDFGAGAGGRFFPIYEEEQEEAVLSFLRLLSEEIERQDLLSDTNFPLAKTVRQFLLSHFTEKVTLQEICRHYHCSAVTVTQNYRKEYGETVGETLERLRMERAASLLSDSERSVSDISDSCGFSDVEYFSRCFKKFTGFPPSVYRKRKRQGDTI